jgi:general secretion pathway protein G
MIQKTLKNKKGFTIIEMMVVLTIIGLLASLGVKLHKRSIIKAKEAVLKENLYQIRDSLEQYYADKSKYPEDLETLVDEGYLRKIPIDPMTKSADTWELIYEEIDNVEDDYEVGVYDVKSGSGKQALDGSYYNEW